MKQKIFSIILGVVGLAILFWLNPIITAMCIFVAFFCVVGFLFYAMVVLSKANNKRDLGGWDD